MTRRWRVLGICLLAASFVCAEGHSPQQNKALTLAANAFGKHRQEITPLPMKCVAFFLQDETIRDAEEFLVDAREVHNKACGGDLNTAPRVATLKVNVRIGVVQLQDPINETYKALLDPPPGAPVLPGDVSAYIRRRIGCNHWEGESTQVDSERYNQINQMLAQLKCTTIEKEEARLKRKYMTRQEIVQAIDDAHSQLP